MLGLILSFIFYNFIVLLVYKHYSKGEYYIKNKDLAFFIFLFILYGAYGNHLGDYWRLNSTIEYYGNANIYEIGTTMEPQYYLLAKVVTGDFFLWRLVISMVTFIGMGYFIKKTKLNNYPTLLLFISMCLFWAAGHRSWWGYIYFYFGTYLFFQNKNPLYLICVFIAYFAHASEVVLLLLFPLSFFKLNKYIVIIAITGMGVILGVFQDFFDSLLNIEIRSEYYDTKVQNYTTRDTGNNFWGNSIGEILQNIFTMVPQYLFYFFLIYKILKTKKTFLKISRPENAIIVISFLLFIGSFVTLFSDINDGTISRRLFNMATFPIIILTGLVFSSITKNNKWHRYFIYSTLLATELVYIFSIYYANLDPHFAQE